MNSSGPYITWGMLRWTCARIIPLSDPTRTCARRVSGTYTFVHVRTHRMYASARSTRAQPLGRTLAHASMSHGCCICPLAFCNLFVESFSVKSFIEHGPPAIKHMDRLSAVHSSVAIAHPSSVFLCVLFDCSWPSAGPQPRSLNCRSSWGVCPLFRIYYGTLD